MSDEYADDLTAPAARLYTEAEVAELVREAQAEAWDDGLEACCGASDLVDSTNPYRETP